MSNYDEDEIEIEIDDDEDEIEIEFDSDDLVASGEFSEPTYCVPLKLRHLSSRLRHKKTLPLGKTTATVYFAIAKIL